MNIITDFVLLLITVLHLLVLIFIVAAPFLNSNYLKLLHILVIPFIILHWYINDNTCALTIAEKYIRENMYNQPVDAKECFSYKFIAPIYDFNNDNVEYSNFIYFAIIALWSVSANDLLKQYRTGKIKSLRELFEN